MRRLLILGAVLLVVLTACSSAPSKIAQRFYEAFQRHEYSSAKSYVCPEFYTELDRWIRETGDLPAAVEFNVEYDETDQSDDRASVRVIGTQRVNNQTLSVDYTVQLEKRGGEWKVCDMQPVP